MKRNLLILVIILLIGFIVNSCGGDEENECSICKNGQHCYTHCVNEYCNVHDCKNHNKNECPICNPICNLGAHLGIDETCNGNNCTLQDYRTAEQKVTFPKEINRYGAKSNYTDQELRDTADKIIAAFGYAKESFANDEAIYNQLLDAITRVCVTKAENGRYTWDLTTLGFDPNVGMEWIGSRIPRVIDGTGLALAVCAYDIIVLQPVDNVHVRMANGKKLKECFLIFEVIKCQFQNVIIVNNIGRVNC